MIPNDLRRLISKYDPSTGSFVKIYGKGYWFDGKHFIEWPIIDTEVMFGWYYKFYKGCLIGCKARGRVKLFPFHKPPVIIQIPECDHFLSNWSFNYVKFENNLYKISWQFTKMNLKGKLVETLPFKFNFSAGYYSILREHIIYRFGSSIDEKYNIETKKWILLKRSFNLEILFEFNKRIFSRKSLSPKLFEFDLDLDEWIENKTILLPIVE